ncbi:MAG TPA: acyl-CoA dehydrogenase, partial [Acidobacteria bacterium]|nr:acyl-CoA dehydrogenase [Acidobacteriota bacterium]
MPITTDSETMTKGGSWLFEASTPNGVFTPEQMTEEHRLVYQTSGEFAREIVQHNDQLETKDWNLTRQLLTRAGELGLLGTDVPETYGGLEFDKVSSAIIAGRLGPAGS